jgi:hypothetical protein
MNVWQLFTFSSGRLSALASLYRGASGFFGKKKPLTV